ncbi:MAG: hypothetical protein MK110_18450 [Fuerstiella sp.]|nr:hypothetical protein [Fuerstiella sp.]
MGKIRNRSVAAVIAMTGIWMATPLMARDVVVEDPNSCFSDHEAAIKLGKALFWDVQLGSGNGAQHACASCHYSAGADSNPERVAVSEISDTPGINDANVVGSRGVQLADFRAIRVNNGVAHAVEAFEVVEQSTPGELSPGFNITGRQAPAAVNSDSIHLFWDGRANNVFNGCNPSGKPATEHVLCTPQGVRAVVVFDAAQASQAVGPPNNEVEMAARGRQYPDLGYKMMRVQPLAMQRGDLADELAQSGETYYDMINDVFGEGPLKPFLSDELSGQYARVSIDGASPQLIETTCTENNFSLFFGMAIYAYEQSLVSETPRPTRAQKRSFKRLRCDKCHYEDGTSHATLGDLGRRPWVVTGVSSLDEDPGIVEGNLSPESPVPNDEGDPGVGYFKSVHILNLPLTGPYFHDGRTATIAGTIDFYIRGGNHDLDKLDSQIRELKLRGNDRQNVIDMMFRLTDPRIEAGIGPFTHPSLPLYVDDSQPGVPTVMLEASDVGNGGLSYIIP